MSTFKRRRACLLLASCVVFACGPSAPPARVALAPPVESTTIGPGDIFLMEIVGEKDLPEEYEVASDGTVDLPYIQNLKVSGLEPQEVARLVRQKLIDEQILSDPSVVIRVKEYRSKRVVVLGQVKAPGSFPFQRGMTLVQAISQAGGLNAIAQAERVRVTRTLKSGHSQSVVINLEAINDGRAEDVPLQSGDRIYVVERIF